MNAKTRKEIKEWSETLKECLDTTKKELNDYEVSCGNVFKDLNCSNAEEKLKEADKRPTFELFKKRTLQDPEVKKEYEALAEEFQMIEQQKNKCSVKDCLDVCAIRFMHMMTRNVLQLCYHHFKEYCAMLNETDENECRSTSISE